MRVLVDADPIIYASAFSAEDCSYQLILADDTVLFFDNGNDMKAWKKANRESEGPVEILDQVQIIDVGPVAHAITAASTTLDYIERACRKEYGDTDRMTLIVSSSSDNFRNAIATVRGYKANRIGARKPEHHGAVKHWLKHERDAILVANREADDELSIMAAQCRFDGVPYVICTIDKDLDQIPGPHFDYKKHVFYDVPEFEARELFWEQVLSGDSVDNIPGVPGVGAAKARKLVNSWIEEDLSDEEIWERIVKVYEQGQQHAKCEYLDRRPADIALEMARLVYLQQELGELWAPPGQPREQVAVGLDD